jgi:hypothetical protein
VDVRSFETCFDGFQFLNEGGGQEGAHGGVSDSILHVKHCILVEKKYTHSPSASFLFHSKSSKNLLKKTVCIEKNYVSVVKGDRNESVM